MKKSIPLIILCILFIQSLLYSAETKRLRIVSLAPATTEILFALGLDEEIIGVSSFCDYPEGALAKEKIGSFSEPNIEAILSLKPDIIFCTGLEQAPIIRKLKQLNLKVYVSDPANIEELFHSIRGMAALTNKNKEGESVINKIGSGIEEVKLKVGTIPQKNRPRVFVEFWNDPLMTSGKGSFIDEMIALAGGINIAYDTKSSYSYFSPEQVIARDPDCIIVAYMVNENASEAIRKRLGWGGISAVRNNRIYNDIDPDLLLRPGPRLVEGLLELHKRLYP